MQNIEQVQALLDGLKAAGTPGPEIIRQVAPACLGWPYVFGAWGEECVPSARKKRVRDDHPTILSACPALNGKSCAVCQWGKGARMYDCRGFTYWLLKECAGIQITGSGCTSQWDAAPNWMSRGEIGQMPDVVCCVFQRRKSDGHMEHTGMHIGGGRIIHCSRNVQEGKTGDSGWTHYGIPKGLYDPHDIPVTPSLRTLRKGAQGEDVKILQLDLISWGYDPGTADGIFGKKTEAAVRNFQRAQGLTVDGVCGPATWTALTAPVVTYTVRIEGVTWPQYKRILEICPLAEAEKEVGPDDA